MTIRNNQLFSLTLIGAWLLTPTCLVAQTPLSSFVIEGGTVIDGNGGQPLHRELGMEWGDGVSNEAHLIVAFPN